MEGALGDAILRFLRIRKGPKSDAHDPDAVRSFQSDTRSQWRLISESHS